MPVSPTDWKAVLEVLGDRATDRQREIVELSATGATAEAISLRLGIDPRNVMRHRGKALGIARLMGYRDSVQAATVGLQEQISAEEEHHLKSQVSALRAEVRELTGQLAEANSLLKIADGLATPHVNPLKVKRKKGRHTVAATAFLSDTHWDEVVSLEQTGGVNEYNRQIAERRLRAFAEKTILVSRDLLTGFHIDHLDLPFGGDMISGNIHEELARTNQSEVMDTVDHWSEKLAEVIVTLASDFNTVFIPCVVGNHGRNTRKPRHKGRVRDNFDWLIYRNVQRIIKGQCKNVTMAISESTDVTWSTANHTYCLTHGDQASGGAGWGGIFSPIMRLYEKKIKAYSGRGQGFDYLIMGHWHQFIDAGAVIVNGTTKGYDEFAHNLNFRPEPPQQAFWLTDPDHGKIFSAPLFVDD